jgi:hypothetical protein
VSDVPRRCAREGPAAAFSGALRAALTCARAGSSSVTAAERLRFSREGAEGFAASYDSWTRLRRLQALARLRLAYQGIPLRMRQRIDGEIEIEVWP